LLLLPVLKQQLKNFLILNWNISLNSLMKTGIPQTAGDSGFRGFICQEQLLD